MNYELAKQLKEAGFPQESYFAWYKGGKYVNNKDSEGDHHDCDDPDLSELIEACGEHFYQLIKEVDGINWSAHFYDIEDSTRQVSGTGSTPEDAVARLWLALNKK